MIREVAKLEVNADQAEAFERALPSVVPLFRRAEGCLDVAFHRSVEHPGRYWLIVEWRELDDHLVGFRQSADFQEWRRIVGGFFRQPPEVEHLVEVSVEVGR